MKELHILVLKVCPCVGTSLYRPLVPHGIGGRVGSEVIMGHVFSWDVLLTTALVGGREKVG